MSRAHWPGICAGSVRGQAGHASGRCDRHPRGALPRMLKSVRVSGDAGATLASFGTRSRKRKIMPALPSVQLECAFRQVAAGIFKDVIPDLVDSLQEGTQRRFRSAFVA